MKKRTFKLLSLALCLAMLFTLAGCSGDASGSGDSSAAEGDAKYNYTGGFDYSQNIAADGRWEGVTALDYVTLPEDYEAITLPEDVTTASDEDVQTQVDSLLASYATTVEVTDRAVEDGDTVNIDYVGSVDGVEFEGGSTQGAGTSVTIGVTSYIDDFLEQLIGHKPGETFDVNVTFPDDYNDSTDADGNTVVLAGKDAVFTTTINYIQGDELLYPEMDDAFVAENMQSIYGWTTAAEANEGIATAIRNSKKYNYMLDYLEENAEITEVPEAISEYMREAQLAAVNNQAASYGISVDTLMMLSGYGSEEDYLALLEEQLPEAAKFSQLRQAIAEQEGMTVTEEDIQEQLGDSYDSYVETYGLNYIKQDMLIGMVDQLLLDEN